MDPEREIGTVHRAARVIGAVARVHLDIARREAEQDAGRVLGGLVLLLLSGLLAGCALALAHVAAVVLLHERRALAWSTSVLAVLTADAVLAATAALLARQRLRRPILRDTRDLVAKTVGALTD